MSMKLVNWNVRWATPRSKHSVEILNRIDRHSPEIVCLTETHSELLQDTPSAHAPTTAMGFKKVAGKYCCGRGSHGSTWTTSVMIGCRRDDTSLVSHGLRWER